jgi:8-amino-7-oxononanoate synthase
LSYLERARIWLEAIRAQGRYRSVRVRSASGYLDFSSNDYLALSTHPQVVEAFRRAQRVGSGGARLLGGAHREHSLLEEELAPWLGRERALLFSSGYHAALGAISVLARTVDCIYSDALNHASLIDGIRATRVERFVYPHGGLPPRAQRAGPALIVTESIFSMDGDAADLGAIFADLGPDDVLLVDEAHALGLVGARGDGFAGALDDPRVVIIGTLSKSFGAHGGFVAGPAELIDLLTNAARTFIFDTALPPAIALAARVSLALIRDREGDERREHLHETVAHLRSGLRSLGFPAIDSPSPIVPVVLGGEERAVALARALEERRITAPAIRPPTVPAGSSRLRLSLRADHQREHVDLLVGSLQACIATL